MITLTREEAHQLLVALQELNRLSIGENAICLPAEIDDAMEVLEARLAQPEHWSDCAVHSEPAYPAGECDCGLVPVAWADKHDIEREGHDFYVNRQQPAKDGVPLYTAPPQREWQGLTDEEMSETYNVNYDIYKEHVEYVDFVLIYRAIEAKLKEKNSAT
jgi:hypothetical protein